MTVTRNLLGEEPTGESERKLIRLLSGGDLRSIGAADRAVEELLLGKRRAKEFLKLMEDRPPVVRMRAADALEKATRKAPQLIGGEIERLLALLSTAQPKEVRWHLLQMASRMQWPTERHTAVLRAVQSAFDDDSAIVRTSALQALAELSAQGKVFKTAFRSHLNDAMSSKTPSVRARARKLAKRRDDEPT